MHKNVENITPPETPPQADSPGPTTDFAQLSLQNAPPNNRGQSQRGRGSAVGIHSAPSKRAASSELPRREKPTSPQENVRKPKPYGPNGAKGPGRARERLGPRPHAARMNLASQRGYGYIARADSRHLGDVRRHGSTLMQAMPRDSGYGSMSSGQNNYQQYVTNQAHPHLATPFPHVNEHIERIVRRSGGPVPVLFDELNPDMILQPESSPISQDQLAAEVKGIYGGLVMVEAKCINIDAAQAADPTSDLGAEQWQALIALHRTLLYEHHDFLMATQHPSATPALSGLAQKYSMPARMWRHGIHAFLEVLRHRRPKSQDYMLAFIYLAYQMMALLFETVPTFTDTWIECLGDLARYRMAIEEDKEIHSIWGGVAARWYNMASDRHPSIGRLYHHLGILERPSLRKMFLYAKSLTCCIPFPNARDSLATMCGPIVQDQQTMHNGLHPIEDAIVSYHAHLFAAPDNAIVADRGSEIISQIDTQPSYRLRDIGVPFVVTNIAALLQLGAPSNRLWSVFSDSVSANIQSSRPSAAAFPALGKTNESPIDALSFGSSFADAAVYDFCYSSFERIMHRGKDRQSLKDILPSAHTILAWLYNLHKVQSNGDLSDDTTKSLLDGFSWGELCELLNTLIRYEPLRVRTIERAENEIFPGSDDEEANRPKPLSEDYLIRGLVWLPYYFPSGWFSCQAEDDGRSFETSAMHEARVERVQYLGMFLAFHTKYIKFNRMESRFDPVEIQRPSAPPKVSGTPQCDESKTGNGHSEERRGAPTPKSRSSTTLSAHSDSEGYTVINTPKSKMSWAKVASDGYEEIRVVDDDHDMQVGI